MTIPTPRWTAETEELVARAWYATVTTTESDYQPLPFEEIDEEAQDLYRGDARAVLTTLADAGLLMPVGGGTREEFGVMAPPGRREPQYPHVRTITTWPDGTTLTGPWREVTNGPA